MGVPQRDKQEARVSAELYPTEARAVRREPISEREIDKLTRTVTQHQQKMREDLVRTSIMALHEHD